MAMTIHVDSSSAEELIFLRFGGIRRSAGRSRGAGHSARPYAADDPIKPALFSASKMPGEKIDFFRWLARSQSGLGDRC